jgi:hypothetical protein
MRTGHILLTTLAIIALATSNDAAAGDEYHLDWGRQYGEEGGEAFALAVTVGRFGNVYAVGNSRKRGGINDASIRAFDSTGRPSWNENIGGPGGDSFQDVATDNGGSILAVGQVQSPVHGQPHGGNLDGFLTRHYFTGLHVWSRSVGSSGNDQCNAVTVDQCGNVFVCGQLDGDLNGVPLPFGRAAFAARYDRSGCRQWLRIVDIPDRAGSHSIAVTRNGCVFVSGYGRKGAGQAYIAKLDPCTGDTLRVEQIRIEGIKQIHAAFSLAVSADGQLVCGGSASLNRDRQTMGFVAAIDQTDLSTQWHVPFTSQNGSDIVDIAIDSQGVIHAAGNTGIVGVPERNRDGFLARVNSHGRLLGEPYPVRTDEFDLLRGVAIDARDRIVVCGATKGVMAGQGRIGEMDAFVLRYSIR